jgi:hypothetical protein
MCCVVHQIEEDPPAGSFPRTLLIFLRFGIRETWPKARAEEDESSPIGPRHVDVASFI